MATIDVTGIQMEFLPIARRDMTDLWPHKDLGWAYEKLWSNDHIESGRSLIDMQKKGDSISMAFKHHYNIYDVTILIHILHHNYILYFVFINKHWLLYYLPPFTFLTGCCIWYIIYLLIIFRMISDQCHGQ